jgi:hypothetical protein
MPGLFACLKQTECLKGNFMEARCKVCGKILHDPISIARGMGPKCAGAPDAGKSFRSSRKQSSGRVYLSTTQAPSMPSLMSFIEEPDSQVPETLSRFPSDLVDLVLSAPAAGSIAARVKLHSRQRNRNTDLHPARALKQIRRVCIEVRLLFWPGLSMNLEPLPCIPCGDNDWKIGENGRVCSKDELVSYLSRYGIISAQPAD